MRSNSMEVRKGRDLVFRYRLFRMKRISRSVSAPGMDFSARNTLWRKASASRATSAFSAPELQPLYWPAIN